MEFLEVDSNVRIPLDELEWRYSTSGGPGGQHANTSNTRVEVIFDIANSPTLTSRERMVLLDRLGPSLCIVARDERSQLRNRQIALQRLAQRLAAALFVARPRHPTRPTRSSKRRHLASKRHAAIKKQQRRRPNPGQE